jgi:hypothetical protein
MKTGSDALGTTENESGRAKHENRTRRTRHRRKRVLVCKTSKRDPTPSIPPKMSSGEQNVKMGPDALDTAENESGGAKHEIETRRPPYHHKRALEHKHENGT